MAITRHTCRNDIGSPICTIFRERDTMVFGKSCRGQLDATIKTFPTIKIHSPKPLLYGMRRTDFLQSSSMLILPIELGKLYWIFQSPSVGIFLVFLFSFFAQCRIPFRVICFYSFWMGFSVFLAFQFSFFSKFCAYFPSFFGRFPRVLPKFFGITKFSSLIFKSALYASFLFVFTVHFGDILP